MKYSEVSFNELLNEISSINGEPSGGSVIAMTACEASSLATMIVSYSINNRNLKLFKEEFLSIKSNLESLTKKFSKLLVEDIENFQELRNAYKIPINSAKDREAKDNQIDKGSRKANIVPTEIIIDCYSMVEILERLKLTVNESLLCDVGVCASLVKSAMNSCHMTILSNLTNIKDEQYIEENLEIIKKADEFYSKLELIVNDIIDKESSKLNIEISRDDS